jgi:hypothetical protein
MAHLQAPFIQHRYLQQSFFHGAAAESSGINPHLPGTAPRENRALAGLLAAAVIASVLVIASQVIDAWSDGHLLLGWVALWSVTFGILALLAPPLRQLCTAVTRRIGAWGDARTERRNDEHLWELAKQDPRVMAELRSALTRQQTVG